MPEKLDVIVLGLGGMGSAAACHLAARGHRVLGLEQFTSPHDRGSSHGQTRVIRQAYFESPAYVPLLLRAYELWRELERTSNRSLLNLCGGLMLGPPGSQVVEGSSRSAVEHSLPHELLDAQEIRRRFPPIHAPPGTIALFEQNAGYVFPEASVKAHLDRAREFGAKLQFEEAVLGWDAEAGGAPVRVRTPLGQYEAERLVITAGPWAGQIMSELRLPLEIERAVLYWFDPQGGIGPFLRDRFPIFISESEDGLLPYGIPAVDGPGGGVKVSFYHAPNPAVIDSPASIQRVVTDEEAGVMREHIARLIPSLHGPLVRSTTCMYTNTPDKIFLIDLHPIYPQVSIAAGFSGHGFKFCSVVGEILADLAEAGQTRHDLHPFRIARFGHASG
jgi:sarcosine oxidase